jgi:hypothetical protein
MPRPIVTLVQYDVRPMTPQMEDRIRYSLEDWLPHKMGHRGVNLSEPIHVPRTVPPEDLDYGPDGQTGKWWWWFNVHLIVNEWLKSAAYPISPEGWAYDYLLCVCPTLISSNWPADRQGAMRQAAICAGTWPTQTQDATRKDRKGETGWYWSTGIIMHETLHTFGVPDRTPSDGNKLIMHREFNLATGRLGYDDKKILRGVLG